MDEAIQKLMRTEKWVRITQRDCSGNVCHRCGFTWYQEPVFRLKDGPSWLVEEGNQRIENLCGRCWRHLEQPKRREKMAEKYLMLPADPVEKAAIEALDGLSGEDQEADHERADDVLVNFLAENGHGSVAAAWRRAKIRVGFWYS